MKRGIKTAGVLILVLAFTASCASTARGEMTGLEEARDYVFSMYNKGSEASASPSDYTVLGTVNISGVQYDVEWSSDVPEESVKFTRDGNTVAVDINEKSPERIDYVLTATVKDSKGKTLSTSFNRYIPAFKESSWSEYIALAADNTVVVKGVITGLISKTGGASNNCIYFQDEDGGYYASETLSDPVADGLKVGLSIRVTGTKDIYSGTHEIKSGSVEVLSDEISIVSPADWTQQFDSAASLKDEVFVEKQSMLVTIKDVEVGKEDTLNGYYYFKKGNLKSYVMISSSECPLTKEEQDEFKAGHASHLGWTADVTGVISVDDGAFYLTPVSVSSFEYKSLPQKSESEMIDFELGNISFEEKYNEDRTLTLALTGASYTDVTLSYTSDCDYAVIDGSTMTLTLPEEETVVTVTVTAESGETVKETSYTFTLEAAPSDSYIIEELGEVEDSEKIKYSLYQANTGKRLYFTGSLSGKYLATTYDPGKAVDVIVEKVEGGFKLSFTLDGEKKYISINSVDSKAVAAIESEPGSVWTLDEKTHVPVVTLNGNTYYLGCYKTYETMSASSTSYILGDNLTRIGVSRFPGKLVTAEVAVPDLEKAEDAEEGKTYILAVSQKNAGKDLIFTGTISGKSLETGSYSNAEKITAEKTDGGFRMKTEEGKYIEIVLSSGKAQAALSETPSCVWTLEKETKVPVTTLSDGNTYYFGCYKTYETMSASILGEKRSTIGVSQFPAYLVEDELEKVELERDTELDYDATYVLALGQKTTGRDIFFTGDINGEYLSTSPSIIKSVNIYLEKEGDGFRMYFIKSGVKTYIEIVSVETKVQAALNTEPGAVWKMHPEAKTPYVTVDGKDYYLGCYDSYETISASETSYILGDNLSKVDVSQFPVMLIKKPSL